MAKYQVAALYPAISKEHNLFLSALDLGIDGAYIAEIEIWSIEYRPDVIPNHSKTIEKIKQVLENMGCKSIWCSLIDSEES